MNTGSSVGGGFGSPAHLAGRFFRSLWPGGPPATDEAWARTWLLDTEWPLWQAMSGPDRRHAVAVARRVSATLRPSWPDPRPVMAAALLHDVGKVAAGLGTCGRAWSTALAIVVGRDRLARGSGRVGRYLRHDVLGAGLLQASGSDPLTICWAREHHLAPARWSVPPRVGAALKAADDD